MTERIIDFSSEGAYLSMRNRNLIIRLNDGRSESVPLNDLGVLVVSNPRVTFTQSVLSGLMENEGALVVCDKASLPVGMLMPVEGNYVQTERFRRQAVASLPTKKRLWRTLVQAKVTQQGRLLRKLNGDDRGLLGLAKKVKSGDPSNVEAQASRRYWRVLFGDGSFRRRRYGEDQNRYLNYGYAILRATVARAVCAAGLHPSLGVHHHNRYNAFCLADDLMEPLRPLVDAKAVKAVKEFGAKAEMDSRVKRVLLEVTTERVTVGGEKRELFDAAGRMASSLVAVFEKRERELEIPEYLS